ncbi:MAG TPA: hypothetical protein PLL75_05555 [Candidatus Omnitrophota bacterium]|nr:hypothetical protein [Candidatus Omnitrophota bacterium]HPS37173.1 hypothetical protein [Candidatus Omnitrophota bacterium]
MVKKNLIGFAAFLTLFSSPVAHAGKVELTTYYPAPYGEYKELQTNNINAKRLAAGDTNNSGVQDAGDLPNRDGDIRLKPQTGDPANWTVGPAGQVAYSTEGSGALYHSNGSAWVASGVSSPAVMTLACGWVKWTSVATDAINGSCTPANCPSDWTSATVYSEPVYGFESKIGTSTTYVYTGRCVRNCTKG